MSNASTAGTGADKFPHTPFPSMFDFLRKLLGKKPVSAKGGPSANPASAQAGGAPDLIRAFDAYGREMHIPREEWRTKVLPDCLKKEWDNPDALYGTIVMALNDGFVAEVLDAARRLHAIDTNRERSSCILGIVLARQGLLDEAEKVLRSHMAAHGESGVILTNLAKVFADRSRDKEAEKVLRHGLDIDPNQENGLNWYAALVRERSGEAAMIDALRVIAANPLSWRAQLHIAGSELASGRTAEATALYGQSLARAGTPAPTDLLMGISGDLGNAGRLEELLRIVEPRFDCAIHGLPVGNNLLKAHLDLGHVAEARGILDQLIAQNRPDWHGHIAFWDDAIAKARLASAPGVTPEAIKLAMGRLNGPVWLSPDSPAAELFPDAPADAPRIACFVATVDTGRTEASTHVEMADQAGRTSRAIPLLIAEQLTFGIPAATFTLVPQVTAPVASFAVIPKPWDDSEACRLATRDDAPADYAVTLHLDARAKPWTLAARLLHAPSALLVEEFRTTLDPETAASPAIDLSRRIATAIAQHRGIATHSAPGYLLPPVGFLPDYLLRLEQLLATRAANDANALTRPMEILDGTLNLCLNCPDNLAVRILLARTLSAMKRPHPSLPPLYRDKVARLQSDHPLPSPAQEVCNRLFKEALAQP